MLILMIIMNMMIKEEKKAIRKMIAEKKKTITKEEKDRLSDIILEKLEKSEHFINAQNVLLYYSLPDEVQTEKFIKKWNNIKNIILPVVNGNDLLLRKYNSSIIASGHYSIMEPTKGELINPSDIDFAIIPGVAFDQSNNRLGRGKGFYDRLLPQLNCKMVGLAFHFQMIENIPIEVFDKKLDDVIID